MPSSSIPSIHNPSSNIANDHVVFLGARIQASIILVTTSQLGRPQMTLALPAMISTSASVQIASGMIANGIIASGHNV